MIEVRWTPQAEDDLEAVYEFIARDSPYYAQITIEGLLAAIDRLEQFRRLAARYRRVLGRIFVS